MDDEMITDPLLQSVLASAAETRASCQSVLDFLEHNRISGAPSEDLQTELSKHQKPLIANLAHLRGLHRRAIYDGRATKQQTAEAKSEIDTLHLQLQNLFYEQRHLQGEIAACEGYNHQYQSLPLVPIEAFLDAHPEHAEDSEHDLMIARINDEHAQRQALEDQRLELLKKKQALIAENRKKKDELDGLDKEIEKFLNGSMVVQKILYARDEKDALVATRPQAQTT